VAIRIRGADGTLLGLAASGLVEARWATMVDGYLWGDATTRAAFVDGWYRSNDLGFMPSSERLVVPGRADNVLNIVGIKIAPGPRETRIRDLSGIAECMLVVQPDAQGIDAWPWRWSGRRDIGWTH
jgi:acyl-coenzyme A synthetase/AMP-(fatty) acid ligase